MDDARQDAIALAHGLAIKGLIERLPAGERATLLERLLAGIEGLETNGQRPLPLEMVRTELELLFHEWR